MMIHVHCEVCDGERTYEVDWVEADDGDLLDGAIVPELSCSCSYDEDKDWEEVSEKAGEYPSH